MSNQVVLTPSDTLILTWVTQMGGVSRDVQTSITHDQLMGMLHSKKKGTSKKSRTPGTRISRHISLTARALKTGSWANGGKVNREAMLESLRVKLLSLTSSDKEGLTDKAIEALELIAHKGLNSQLQDIVRDIFKVRMRGAA